MKPKIPSLSLLIALLTLFALPLPALADGIIIPKPPVCMDCPPPPPPNQTPYLSVQNHRVSVSIDHQVATTRVDQVFRNDSQWALEGTYIFPLPENAAISEFSMWIDGQKVEGQLYTKEEARRIYDDIVRRRLDPALLEYIGRDLFQASIFPIEPGDTRRVVIEYTELLPVDNGLVKYVYPLSTEKFSAKPLEDVSISVDIKSDQPIKAVYSPSHPVSVDRPDDTSALVGWEDRNALPDTDFALYYSLSPEDLGLSLLSYKNNDEDGFFTMLIAPSIESDEVIEKDVVLVLDTSGSMEGEKLAQAQDALNFVLDHLNPGDRFNVVAFSTGARSFAGGLQAPSAAPEAKDFVNRLRAEGSTDINRALLEAIVGLNEDSARPVILIFLTDGLPTSGVTEAESILSNVKNAAPKTLRLFPFGVGDDVDTFLLDSLARELRGASAYVRPGERVDEAISGFYAKVSAPVLADIDLSVDGARVEEIYPYPLPDLFAGTQLIVTGRYPQGGSASVTLAGTVNGRSQKFVYQDLTFARSGGQDFIPRLWATRKIGYLLNQIRLHGENKEAVDQIVKLSVRYGIITPYTSFLVEEPEAAFTQEGQSQMIEMAVEEAAQDAIAPRSGATAVKKAVENMAFESAEMAAPMPTRVPGAASGEDNRALTASTITAVGDKAFVLRDGVWTDTTFNPDTMTAASMPFASTQFMDFIAQHPAAAKYFSLGEQVIVVIDGQAYQSVAADAEPAVASAPAKANENGVSPATPAASTPSTAKEPGVSSAKASGPAEITANSTLPAAEDASPAAATDAPTGSVWVLLGGIVVLALLMGGAGWLVMRRS